MQLYLGAFGLLWCGGLTAAVVASVAGGVARRVRREADGETIGDGEAKEGGS